VTGMSVRMSEREQERERIYYLFVSYLEEV